MLFTDPDHIDATVASILIADKGAELEPLEVTRARHQESRLAVELNRVIAAIRAGMDPVLAAGQTREIQAGIATAKSVVERWERSHERVVPLSEADVRTVLSDADDLVQLLRTADRIGRAGLYQSFGISLKYEREAATGRELVRVRSQLCRGGGSPSPRTERPQYHHMCW